MTLRPQYKATPDTLEDGQFSNLRTDNTGALVTAGDSVTGATDDTAWDGVADDASVISLLKAIHDLLVQIEINTAGTP